MSFSISRNFDAPANFDKAIVHFSKNSGRLSPAGPEVIAFGNHCLAKFQPIFDCFIPNSKLKYGDSGNIKTDCVE